jgi:hypothetical protein
MIFCCAQANLSACLLAGDLTTFTSLLAEVTPIEDGGQTNLEDQQVNLSVCLLAGGPEHLHQPPSRGCSHGGQTNLEDQQVNLSTCLLAGDLTTFPSLLAEVAPRWSDQPKGPAGNLSTCLLAGDLTTFTSLLAEVAPIEDGGQTNLEDQQVT